MKSTVTRSSVFLSLLVGWASSSLGGPIPPGPIGSSINNSAAPQVGAQFNVASGTVRGILTAGELRVSTLNITGPITGTFIGSGAGLTNIPWSGVLKAGSNLSDLTTRDHSVLTSTGTNSHAAIDSHLGATAAHGATSANTASRIVARDGAGSFSAGAITATSFLGPLTGNADTATRSINLAGGLAGAIPYQAVPGFTSFLPAGPYNYLLQGRGSAAPVWTSSPTILGANITGIPLAGLLPGTLPASIPASSITATGVAAGTYGGPTQSAQITVGTDGRLTSALQLPIPGLDPSIPSHLVALDVSTATLRTDLTNEALTRAAGDVAVGVATGTLRTDLGAETLARTNADAILGVSTASIYSALQSTGAALTAETNRAVLRENAIAVSTGTNYAAINSTAAALTAETARAIARENAIAVSTGSVYSALISTGIALTVETAVRVAGDAALDLAKVNRAGDTMSGQLTVQSSITATGAIQATGSIVNVSSMNWICLNGAECVDAFPVPQAANEYFLTGNNSDVSAYKLMYSSVPATIPASTFTVTLSGTEVLISTYITQVGYPGITLIPDGWWRFRFNASVDNSGPSYKNVKGFARVYTYLNGVETYVAQSDYSTDLTQMPAATGRTIDSNVQQISMSTSTRLIVRFYAYCYGSGPLYPALSVYRDNDYFNSVHFPTIINSGSYVTYNTATNDVNLNGHNLTANNVNISSNVYIVGFSSAAKYYGDGSSLTGLAGGGGDVVKAATQTLTGSNTFNATGTGGVSISSLTAGGLTVTGGIVSNGDISGVTLHGNGSAITGISAPNPISLTGISAPSGVSGKGVMYFDSALNVFMVKENNGVAKPIVDPPGNWTCTVRTAQVCYYAATTAKYPSIPAASCVGNEKMFGHSVALVPSSEILPLWNSTCTSSAVGTVNVFSPNIIVTGQGISGNFQIGVSRDGLYVKIVSSINCCR